MTDLSVPTTFTTGPAVAAEVNGNFDAIETFVNTTGVPVLQDGAVSAAAKIADGVVTAPKLAAARHVSLTSASVGVANNTWEVITWGTEVEDASGMHAAAATKVIPGASGLYLIEVVQVWASYGSGDIGVDVRKNANGSQTGGTDIKGYSRPASAEPVDLIVTARLAASDEVEVFSYQTSGGPITRSSAALRMTWLGN